MTPLTSARLALLLIGIAMFVYSLRTGEEWARWAAIGVLAAAVVIRLVDRLMQRKREEQR